MKKKKKKAVFKKKANIPNGQARLISGKLKNSIASAVLLVASLTICLAGAEVYARLYDHYSDFPIWPKKEKRDDSRTSRIGGTKIEKPEGVKRILLLGDSIAFGQAIMKKETFSERLEDLLNSEKGNPEYEVVNTGFMGIDTVQELYVLVNRGPFGSQRPELLKEGFVGLAYDPDLIMLTYAVTTDAIFIDQNMPFEVAMPHRWPSDRSRKWSFGPYSIPVPKAIDSWLGENSYFYQFFLIKYKAILNALGLLDNHSNKIEAMFKPDAKGWQRSRAALYQIAKISSDNNIPAILILWGTDNDSPIKDIYSLIENEGEKAGFHVLNLVEDVVWPKENFAVSMLDQHDNPKAHKIAADAIHHFLKEKNLVVR
ncbi:hypothetical protein KAR91_76525 [Candidatus Pacearchaeota archaeon]|nr:hypothetical protein [Candidatus Pacearchaeota archaeon]